MLHVITDTSYHLDKLADLGIIPVHLVSIKKIKVYIPGFQHIIAGQQIDSKYTFIIFLRLRSV